MKSQATRNLEDYQSLHSQGTKFGTSSAKRLDELCFIFKQLNLGYGDREVSVVDFGCGRSELSSSLARSCSRLPGKYSFFRYDPAIPDISEPPSKPVDFLINTDVLEHIYEDELPDILKDMSFLSDKCYFNISTRLAKRILPNGENAHVTVKPGEWWLEKIREYFQFAYILKNKKHEVTIITFQPNYRIYLYYRTFSIRRNFGRVLKKLNKLKR